MSITFWSNGNVLYLDYGHYMSVYNCQNSLIVYKKLLFFSA